MRVLTQSENHRLNEFVGFVGISLAILLALSLISYSPRDVSFNVASPAPVTEPAQNWIGPIGAFTADLAFQVLGYAAFLLPAGLLLLALRWFKSHPVETPIAKVVGYALLILFLPAEFVLLSLPKVRGALPPGGLIGSVLATGLRAALNPLGAHLVAVACVLAGLFLSTRFSFLLLGRWLSGPLGTNGLFGKLSARYKAWREARDTERLRKRFEEMKIAGRQPVPPQTIASKEGSADKGEKSEEPKPGPMLIKFPEPPATPRKGSEPKIARGKTSYRLPSPGLLRLAERGERMAENELKEYARAIEQK